MSAWAAPTEHTALTLALRLACLGSQTQLESEQGEVQGTCSLRASKCGPRSAVLIPEIAALSAALIIAAGMPLYEALS